MVPCLVTLTYASCGLSASAELLVTFAEPSVSTLSAVRDFNFMTYRLIVMRPSSLGGGRILRRTLSVCLSVRPVMVTERHVTPPSELQ